MIDAADLLKPLLFESYLVRRREFFSMMSRNDDSYKKLRKEVKALEKRWIEEEPIRNAVAKLRQKGVIIVWDTGIPVIKQRKGPRWVVISAREAIEILGAVS